MTMTSILSVPDHVAVSLANFWRELTVNHFAGEVTETVEQTQGTVSNDILLTYGGYALVICFITIILLYLPVKHILKAKDVTRHIKVMFVVAWVLAFIIYDVGMYTGQYISLLTNVPMAVLQAFGTFLLSNNISAVTEPFHRSWVFMLCYSLSHALSAFVSSLFLIRVFGFNVIQKWRLLLERCRWGNVKGETFVLWGINNATGKMAASIKQHFAGKDASYRIIVVTTEGQDDTSDAAMGIGKIFEFISLRDSELRELQDLGCLLATSHHSLDCINCGGADIIGSRLRLRSVAKILSEQTSERIHMLFLSDNERQNLHDVSVLLGDSTLLAFAKGNRQVRFYCHARYNGVHRVIEDLHYSSNTEVQVIDSSHINVELLKGNDVVLPVNFVNVERDATVSTAFNAMVLGFSEVGQDAVRFLYEYGAFVRSGGDDHNAVRSEFHLDVVDNHMDEKAGVFMSNTPSIRPSLAYLPEMTRPDSLIELHKLDCRSAEFFAMLEQKIKTLNYIVIATDDDELNMTMGVRVLRAATRYRDNLDRLCILIRIHDDADGRFAKIAEYYNKLWASQDVDNLDGKKLNKKFERTAPCILPLYIFGLDKDIYTYDNIIDDRIVKKAIVFKEKYEASTREDYTPPVTEAGHAWFVNKDKLMQVQGPYHPAYAGVMRLRRTQGQDIANSMHCRTKELLRDKAMGFTDFNWSTLRRYDGHTTYSTVSGAPVDPRVARFLTVMAQTEHLRWNASHEIMGYVHGNATNEVRLHHDCLTDWSELSELVRSFDYNVVDITLGVINADNKLQTNTKN